jgi:uncharacterized protein (TIGR01319 family)
MKPILCIDFGSTYTKVVGVDIDEPKILGRTQSFTTVKEDINIGLEKAIAKLSNITGIEEWPVRFACSSAAGGLKMIAIGLVPQLTMEAAKRAALSAGAKILKTYSYELNEAEITEIAKLKPDIILFTGGIDGGNQKVVLHNAQQLTQCKVRCPLVFAGNKAVSDEVSKILRASDWKVYVADNVMPTLNELRIDSARALIRDIFLEHIVIAKGLSKVQNTIDNILMPTPSAVLLAAELLANGHIGAKGIGELIIVDVGGATTDVHSVADGHPTQSNVLVKGLSDLKIKRTVEGDLGARYSLPSLVEVVGIEAIAATIPTSVEVVNEILKDLQAHPESFVSEPGLLKTLDDVAAEIAVKESVTRHAGMLEVHYTPFGTVYQQTGKDLSQVSHVIGTGGPLIYHHNVRSALRAAQFDPKNPFSLKPLSPNYYIDKQYILAAMGLLSIKYPKQALALLKSAIIEV